MQDDSDVTARGSCLCGTVRYRVRGALRPVIGCHCVQCRKSSGHHVAATGALRENVEVTGAVTWYRSSPLAQRGFCGVCGSNLFWDGPGRHLSIHAGTIDGDPGVRMVGHIHCASRGGYYEIGDGLPAFGGDEPSMTAFGA